MKRDIKHLFETIYESDSDAIFRFCLIRVSDREQALDITQEVFVRLWQTLGKGEELSNHRAFIFKVAHNLVIDWYRKKKSLSLEKIIESKEDQDYEFPDETTLDNLDLEPEGRFLLEKIKELPGGEKNPAYLRFVEDLTPGEIAKILGISVNAASVRVNRALLELRKKTGYN